MAKVCTPQGPCSLLQESHNKSEDSKCDAVQGFTQKRWPKKLFNLVLPDVNALQVTKSVMDFTADYWCDC